MQNKLTNTEIVKLTPAELAKLGYKIYQVELPKYPTTWDYFFIAKTKKDIASLQNSNLQNLNPILRKNIDLKNEKDLNGFYVCDGENYEPVKDVISYLEYKKLQEEENA